MTKMDAKSSHRRSCANSSVLPIRYVWKWSCVPCSGSGSPALGALPPETARKQPGEPPKIDLQGVDGVDKLVRAPRQSPLQPHPYCAAAVARPSGAIGGPDRDQPRLLCPPTRAARAALRGRTIIWHHQTTVRPRPRERLIYFRTRQEGPSLKKMGVFAPHTRLAFHRFTGTN